MTDLPPPHASNSSLSRPTAGRMPSLDGWRAIAILLVLLSHFPNASGAPDMPAVAGLGDLGVRIFFVLSGFLITFLLLAEYEARGEISLRSFYARRILRIFPIYFLYLFVLLTLEGVGLYRDHVTSWIGAFSFTRNYLGRGDSATGHFWSLAVEEQFYLLWPIVLVAARLYKHRNLALLGLALVILAAFASRSIDCRDSGFLCSRVLGAKSSLKYADSLAIGCAGAFGLLRWRIHLNGLRASLLLNLTVSALIFSILLNRMIDAGVPGSAMITLQALLIITCIILSTACRPMPAYDVLNSWIAIQLGLISYSLYVWHFMFLSSYMGEKFSAFLLYDWRIWWIPALLVAAVSFNLIELPVTTLRAKFSQRLVNPLSKPEHLRPSMPFSLQRVRCALRKYQGRRHPCGDISGD